MTQEQIEQVKNNPKYQKTGDRKKQICLDAFYHLC